MPHAHGDENLRISRFSRYLVRQKAFLPHQVYLLLQHTCPYLSHPHHSISPWMSRPSFKWNRTRGLLPPLRLWKKWRLSVHHLCQWIILTARHPGWVRQMNLATNPTHPLSNTSFLLSDIPTRIMILWPHFRIPVRHTDNSISLKRKATFRTFIKFPLSHPIRITTFRAISLCSTAIPWTPIRRWLAWVGTVPCRLRNRSLWSGRHCLPIQ